jgi:septum site-determining protein MinC
MLRPYASLHAVWYNSQLFIVKPVTPMSDTISIKGGKDGLRVQIDPAVEWSLVLEQLAAQFTQSGSFFNGAKLTLEIGDRALNEEQVSALVRIMQQHGLQPEAIGATDRESRNVLRAAGLTARPLPRYEQTASVTAPESEAILLTRTVRSGQVVRHSGHITLIGDVNPGAEIVAGGHVIVWGRLRGLVHAGALGNRDAIVCALELRPTQLRIADQIARTPEGAVSAVPEMARLTSEQITVEQWDIHRRG